MDNHATAEEQFAPEMLRQKLDEMEEAVQTNIAPVQDYVSFTLQKAFFKCGYECFDRSKRQEEVNNCVDNCINILTNAENSFYDEMARFQEKLSRDLMVCIYKYGEARLQQKTGAVFDLLSRADQSIQDSMKILPHLTNKLKASFGISDNGSSFNKNCSIPITNVQHTFDNEISKFQEKLNISLMVCQDKYEAARLKKKTDAMNDLVSCNDQSIQESIKTLPLLANKLKAAFGISDNGSS